MDRNVVIATVLIALIMVVWLTWLTPPAPPPAPISGIDSTEVVDPFEADPVEEDAPIEADTPAVADARIDSTVAGAMFGEGRIITIESELYTARLSTRGATLVSWQLKDFRKADDSLAVQMVDSTQAGSLSLVFTSPSNRVYDTREFVFEADTQADRIEVGDAGATITFSARLGEGALRTEWRFEPGSYEVVVDVSMDNPESFMTRNGYELVWNGAIPFTEIDHENESQSSGAFARSGGEVEQIGLAGEEYAEKSIRGDVSWVAVKGKYFVVALIPEKPGRGAELIGERTGDPEGPSLYHDFSASLDVEMPGAEMDRFRLYVGPLELKRIRAYGVDLYDMVDYGFTKTITRPLAKWVFVPTFGFLAQWLPNYGLVIIVFSILIKLLVHPLTKSSFTNMAKMRELQPRMEAIKEKYADNPQKQQEATMKMYKETGVNPLGGCLPMLLQYPIIIALWQFLPQAIEIRQQGFLWAADLSAPDVILDLPFTIPLYGNFIAGFTLMMGISMVFQMRLQATPSTGAQAKIFTYVFPVMIFVIFNRLASGLNLYYLCYNILSAGHQKLINRRLEAKKEAGESLLEAKPKRGRGNKAKPARAAGRKGGGRNRRKG